MPTRLDNAAKSYKIARSAHATAQRRAEEARGKADQARAVVESARAELASAIVESARAGVRQVDIARTSGYTRERIRQLLRQAGVDPA